MNAPASHPVKNGLRPRRIAALHRQGDAWRFVVIESGAFGANGLRVVEARSISFGDVASVAAALARQEVDRVMRVLPASSVVCRVVPAPEGEGADAALRLLAEASLPAGLPAHRRAAATLEAFAAPGPREALLVGWPGDLAAPTTGFSRECWIPEPAALLWLLRRRARAALYADRGTGSISAFAAGPRRTALRALRETPSDPRAWREAVESRFVQTAAAAGLALNGSTRDCAGDSATLILDAPATLVDGIPGASDDAPWLAHYAVALAAAASALASSAASDPPFSMRADPPDRTESTLVRAARWIASPRIALRVIAASAVLAFIGPLALAGARYALLNSKSGGLHHQQEQARAAALSAAYFEQLERRRWPMTRLIATLSGTLPVGVTLESLRIEAGERLTFQGRAESLELINLVQSRLNQSGVFAEAAIDRTRDAEGGRGVEFDASAAVARPHDPSKGLEDFAAKTLAQRLYGDHASDPTNPDREEGTSSIPSNPGQQAGVTPPARERSTRPEPAATIPSRIPDEDIAKLDAKAAMKQWTDRQKASKQPGLDAAVRDRLKDEAEKCRQRMLAARKEAAP